MFRVTQNAPAFDDCQMLPYKAAPTNPGCPDPLAGELFTVTLRRLGCMWCMPRQTSRGSYGDLKSYETVANKKNHSGRIRDGPMCVECVCDRIICAFLFQDQREKKSL